MPDQFVALLEKRKPDIEKILAKWVTPERFFSMALQLERNPALRQCTPESLVECVLQAAMAGLEIGGPKQHVYVIPYNNQAQLQIGWRGLAHLRMQSGSVIKIDTDIVCDSDDFVVGRSTDGDTFRHMVDFKADRTEAKCYAAYAIATLTVGDRTFEVLSKERIQRHRAHSKQPNSMMWTKFWEEAYRKTAYRVLDKRLPDGVNEEAQEKYANAVTIEARGYKTQDEDLGIGSDDDTPDPPTAVGDPPASAAGPKAAAPRKANKVEVVQEPAKPKADDRVLSLEEQDTLVETWIANGNKASALPAFLTEKAGTTDTAQIKFSQYSALKAEMEG